MKSSASRPWLFWAVSLPCALIAVWAFVKNPQDIDRLLINIALAFSAYITLKAKLLSLANAGFMAMGAYASAIFVVKAGLPLALALPLSVALCGLAAFVIGLPVLRLKDVYLAIATLGFGEVVRVVIIMNPDLTGGPTGANLSTGFTYALMKQTQSWMLIGFVVLLIYLFFWMARSKTGRALKALQENAAAAETLGINAVQLRSFTFVLSAMIAAAAGAWFAHDVGSLDNTDFQFGRAVNILSFAVLGGTGHWLGPILGAGVLTVLPIALRDGLGSSVAFLKNFVQLPTILNGLALMLSIAFLPGGLVSALPRRRLSPRKNALLPLPSEQAAVTPEPPSNDPLIEIRGLSRSFGGVNAVSDLSFAWRPGTIYGLIGPNGAGKTTLVNLLSGLLKPSSGTLLWKGQDVTRWPAHRLAQAGLARTFQNIRLFAEMTVLENVIVGFHAHVHTNLLTTWLRLPRERKEERRVHDEALALLERLGLTAAAPLPAGTLSYGDQRRVEIARALATRPRVLLLDEPAAGMNDEEAASLGVFIVELKRQGLCIIVIEHHIDLILSVCDEILVLNFGQKIAAGTPQEIAANETVIEAYLGKA